MKTLIRAIGSFFLAVVVFGSAPAFAGWASEPHPSPPRLGEGVGFHPDLIHIGEGVEYQGLGARAWGLRATERVVGYSYGKRAITSFYFGAGPKVVVFVGGMHGGYEWNTVLLAYQAIDYFSAHPEAVPDEVTLIIIPVANPDGLAAVAGEVGPLDPENLPLGSFAARFNGRGVDLNRNWECDWQPVSWWWDVPVSGGKKVFSEPESRALSKFFLAVDPWGVVFWHSKAGGVFAAGCDGLYQPARELAGVYSEASGYPVADGFTYYEVTGDASDWLSTQGIPAITVELATREESEWEENLGGMVAVLDLAGQQQTNERNPGLIMNNQ